MQVAVFCEDCGICFGILVVAAADIGSLGLDFTGNVLGIFRIDAHIGAVYGFAAGAGCIGISMFIGK